MERKIENQSFRLNQSDTYGLTMFVYFALQSQLYVLSPNCQHLLCDYSSTRAASCL